MSCGCSSSSNRKPGKPICSSESFKTPDNTNPYVDPEQAPDEDFVTHPELDSAVGKLEQADHDLQAALEAEAVARAQGDADEQNARIAADQELSDRLNNLDSSQVANASGVAGATVSAALDALDEKIPEEVQDIIVQEAGEADDKVISQKVVSNWLFGDPLNLGAGTVDNPIMRAATLTGDTYGENVMIVGKAANVGDNATVVGHSAGNILDSGEPSWSSDRSTLVYGKTVEGTTVGSGTVSASSYLYGELISGVIQGQVYGQVGEYPTGVQTNPGGTVDQDSWVYGAVTNGAVVTNSSTLFGFADGNGKADAACRIEQGSTLYGSIVGGLISSGATAYGSVSRGEMRGTLYGASRGTMLSGSTVYGEVAKDATISSDGSLYGAAEGTSTVTGFVYGTVRGTIHQGTSYAYGNIWGTMDQGGGYMYGNLGTNAIVRNGSFAVGNLYGGELSSGSLAMGSIYGGTVTGGGHLFGIMSSGAEVSSSGVAYGNVDGTVSGSHAYGSVRGTVSGGAMAVGDIDGTVGSGARAYGRIKGTVNDGSTVFGFVNQLSDTLVGTVSGASYAYGHVSYDGKVLDQSHAYGNIWGTVDHSYVYGNTRGTVSGGSYVYGQVAMDSSIEESFLAGIADDVGVKDNSTIVGRLKQITANAKTITVGSVEAVNLEDGRRTIASDSILIGDVRLHADVTSAAKVLGSADVSANGGTSVGFGNVLNGGFGIGSQWDLQPGVFGVGRGRIDNSHFIGTGTFIGDMSEISVIALDSVIVGKIHSTYDRAYIKSSLVIMGGELHPAGSISDSVIVARDLTTGYQGGSGGASYAILGRGVTLAGGIGECAAFGNDVTIGAFANNSAAFGNDTVILYNAVSSVALGNGSEAERPHTVSVGSSSQKRAIARVAKGTEPDDAVTVGQMNSGESLVTTSVPAGLSAANRWPVPAGDAVWVPDRSDGAGTATCYREGEPPVTVSMPGVGASISDRFTSCDEFCILTEEYGYVIWVAKPDGSALLVGGLNFTHLQGGWHAHRLKDSIVIVTHSPPLFGEAIDVSVLHSDGIVTPLFSNTGSWRYSSETFTLATFADGSILINAVYAGGGASPDQTELAIIRVDGTFSKVTIPGRRGDTYSKFICYPFDDRVELKAEKSAGGFDRFTIGYDGTVTPGDASLFAAPFFSDTGLGSFNYCPWVALGNKSIVAAADGFRVYSKDGSFITTPYPSGWEPNVPAYQDMPWDIRAYPCAVVAKGVSYWVAGSASNDILAVQADGTVSVAVTTDVTCDAGWSYNTVYNRQRFLKPTGKGFTIGDLNGVVRFEAQEPKLRYGSEWKSHEDLFGGTPVVSPGGSVSGIVALTAEEYNALPSRDPKTFYAII